MKRISTYFFGIVTVFGALSPAYTEASPLMLPPDTVSLAPLSAWGKVQQRTNKIVESKAFQITYVGVPLVVAGLIVKGEDTKFRSLRNNYIPEFRYHYDDYLQYAPAALMLGLKAAGVKGRSSWPRMLVSDAFSVGIMALTVNAIKQTAQVTRPDGSNTRSFPSGHTATAFLTATMLHKEYGLTRSPWYSIGGYTMATATAVSRILNNKHWLSDVLVGAGIGILATEVGYLLADLIFKEKGLVSQNVDYSSFDYAQNPSFFGLYVGFSLMPTRFPLTPDVQLKASPGSTTGVEGAWFMNRYLGIGGRFSAASLPLSTTAPLSEVGSGFSYAKGLQSDPLNMMGGYVGPYFSLPITDRLLLGAKALVGGNYTFKNKIKTYGTLQGTDFVHDLAEVKDAFNFAYGTGASLSYILRPELQFRLFADYNWVPTQLKSSVKTPYGVVEEYQMRKNLQTINFGISVNAMLW